MRSPRATRGNQKNKPPSKRELAQIAALDRLKMTPYAIAKRTGINNHTVAKYLATQEAYADPGMEKMIAAILDSPADWSLKFSPPPSLRIFGTSISPPDISNETPILPSEKISEYRWAAEFKAGAVTAARNAGRPSRPTADRQASTNRCS